MSRPLADGVRAGRWWRALCLRCRAYDVRYRFSALRGYPHDASTCACPCHAPAMGAK